MQNQLRNLFCEVLRVPSETVEDNLGIGEIPTWDSLGHMKLIAAIEQCYEFELTFKEIVAMCTFGDICRIVGTRREDKAES